MNPFFKRPPQSELYDSDMVTEVHERYLENKAALVAALVEREELDGHRFEATLLWYGEVLRFHDANERELPGDLFDDFETITRYLSTGAQYSRTQLGEFQAAVVRWARFLKSAGFEAPRPD